MPASQPADRLAIEADGLAKRYGDEVAVDGVDLAIERGTVYGFLGPNGAGKTTTMRMLTTLTRPTDGSARVFGRPVSDRAAVREAVGYLPESPPVFEELTIAEQLEYAASLRDLPADVAEERIEGWLERFDLAGDAGKRIDDCSKGMRQKVGLIQALLHEPEVVFLDEPTSGLDPRAARTVRDAIAEHAAEGTTVFLSTHILPVVEELADVVGVLHEGRLVAEGPPAELTAQVERGGPAGEAAAGDAGAGASGDAAAGEGDASTLEDVFLAVTTDDAAAVPE